jgi:hypothetical protein
VGGLKLNLVHDIPATSPIGSRLSNLLIETNTRTVCRSMKCPWKTIRFKCMQTNRLGRKVKRNKQWVGFRVRVRVRVSFRVRVRVRVRVRFGFGLYH